MSTTLAPLAPAAAPWRTRLVRRLAPWIWRRPARVAAKLAEFGATEAGSALDMLAAAEQATDPRLRRLYFRHALDEARHARLFREAAAAVHPVGAQPLSARAQAHARRQDLYATLGPARFLAFVHLAEQRGEAHFRGLVSALEDDHPALAATFARVARDERFHVAYSRYWLGRVDAHATTTLRRAHLDAAWSTWKRSGRVLGEAAATAVLWLVYVLLVPPFALATRLLDPDRPGWKRAPQPAITHERARRQAR
jgi:rubrerythrin